MALSAAEKTKRYRERRYAEIEQMEKIPCACGCGTMIAPFNRLLQPARYAVGHATRGRKINVNPNHGQWAKGKKKSPEAIAKRTSTRYEKYGDGYGAAKGFKRSDEERKRVSERNKRLYAGEGNPFYGKRHSPETKATLSEKLSGENNPGWKGGVATLPYGPGFTRKFKRLIRERDNHTCQSCGVTRAEYGQTLQVHHIDHDKNNNDPTNLVTVCGRCNVWYSYHRDEPFVVMGRKSEG